MAQNLKIMFTMEQLNDKKSPKYISDKLLLQTLINERRNKLTNVYSPLSKRLAELNSKVEKEIIKCPK